MKTNLPKLFLIVVLAMLAGSWSKDDIPMQKVIEIVNGEIHPNVITCFGQSTDRPACNGRNPTSRPGTFPLPYTGMLDHPGWASVRTNISIAKQETDATCRATVTLWSEVAGKSRGHGNVGGVAACSYVYKTQIHLARTSPVVTRDIRVRFQGNNQGATIVGNVSLNIEGLAGKNWAYEGSHTESYSNVPPGIYDVTVSFPTVSHGSYANAPEVISRATITSSIVLEVF